MLIFLDVFADKSPRMNDTDKYQEWLQEMIDWYTDWCLKDVEKMGYPGKIKFASQDMRYALESYQECLEKYLEFKKETNHEWYWCFTITRLLYWPAR